MLSALALQDLARSGIDPAAAERAGMYSVEDAREVYLKAHAAPALVIPYYGIDGAALLESSGEQFLRWRYLDNAPVRLSKSGKWRTQRYAQRPATGCKAYIPQVDGWAWSEVVDDSAWPILITEGEKKALACCLAGIPCIGLGGVYNFLEDGELLKTIVQLKPRNRQVYIAYDSDVTTNHEVQQAESRLTELLATKHGARVHLVRLVEGPNGEKQGLDDLLVSQGEAGLINLIKESRDLSKADAAIIALNKEICWLERDGRPYDLKKRYPLKVASLREGSTYAAYRTEVYDPRRDMMVPKQTARLWLTSPLRLGYEDLIFDPGGETVVVDDNGFKYLNKFNGFNIRKGDVSNFLRLNEYIMQPLREDGLEEWPLKFFAFKAQNPKVKIPNAIVMQSGAQGGGKSLWAHYLLKAFAPYSVQKNAKFLVDGDYNSFLDNTLLAVVDEIDKVEIDKAEGMLKTYISEVKQEVNEKYEVAKQINSYTQFILTSNKLGVGSTKAGDRRYFVVGAAPKHPSGSAFYEDMYRELREGMPGPALMHYLLSYDLKGWRPEGEAPVTREKLRARFEGQTAVERLAEEMLEGNSDHVILRWMDASLSWAATAQPYESKRAGDIAKAIPLLQVRPWYTPDELFVLFPLIFEQRGYGRRDGHTPGALSRALREAHIPYLKALSDVRGFHYKGRWRQFLIVKDQGLWEDGLTQAEFERLMATFPRYRDLKKKMA